MGPFHSKNWVVWTQFILFLIKKNNRGLSIQKLGGDPLKLFYSFVTAFSDTPSPPKKRGGGILLFILKIIEFFFYNFIVTDRIHIIFWFYSQGSLTKLTIPKPRCRNFSLFHKEIKEEYLPRREGIVLFLFL